VPSHAKIGCAIILRTPRLRVLVGLTGLGSTPHPRSRGAFSQAAAWGNQMLIFPILGALGMALFLIGLFRWRAEHDRLLRFVPEAFNRGIRILAEPVPANQRIADAEVYALPRESETLFIRSFVSTVLPAFPAGRIFEKSGVPYVELRLGPAFTLHYGGALIFGASITLLSRTWAAGGFLMAIAFSVAAIVLRERRWARRAARACVSHFKGVSVGPVTDSGGRARPYVHLSL
jgi:hypothetical protein